MQTISLLNLTFIFIPVLAVIGLMIHWSLHPGNSIYALFRMVLQLVLIGYCLVYIFDSNSPWLVVVIIVVMIVVAGWIALRTVEDRRPNLYRHALIAITVGGGVTLMVVIAGVLSLDPWYQPRYLVPLAGMTFACSMNGVSLAAERYYAELGRGITVVEARNVALQTAMIPVINSLFAVGLVHLPGMMTGQILSGVSPLIAVRYQIMVLCMMFAATGLSATCFLVLTERNKPAISRN